MFATPDELEKLTLDDMLAKVSYALKDGTRREILRRLRDKPMSLSELIEEMKIEKSRKPLIHYHLKILREAGLIEYMPVNPAEDMRIKRYTLTELGETLLTFFETKLKPLESPFFKLFGKIVNYNRKLYNIFKISVVVSLVVTPILGVLSLSFIGKVREINGRIVIEIMPLLFFPVLIIIPLLVLTLSFAIISHSRKVKRSFS